MLNHEKLVCLGTGEEIPDDGLVLTNPKSEKPALLRAKYFNRDLKVRNELPGIFKYSDWLPVNRVFRKAGSPVTYHSQGLGKHLGLNRLYITFNGYWPEKGANMETGTFKECEAYSVCARFPVDGGKTLVVASAGNTARAFMRVGSDNHIPMVIVVPEKNLGSLWYTGELDSCVKVVAAGGNSNYTDAIRLSDLICGVDGFTPEGGAKNVARRDGMGTTVLSAVTTIGEIPDYYFQAIGSGTGAIAAHEANLRFIDSGAYGRKMMCLQLSQNEPFIPIYEAWKANSRAIPEMDEKEAQKQIDVIEAKVLSNRKPPYAIIGGLFDCLQASGGDVMTASNSEARAAQQLFLDTEGCDICPESGIALASLIKKVQNEEVPKDSVIMLNITGGGFQNIFTRNKTKTAIPDLIIPKDHFRSEYIQEQMESLKS